MERKEFSRSSTKSTVDCSGDSQKKKRYVFGRSLSLIRNSSSYDADLSAIDYER